MASDPLRSFAGELAVLSSTQQRHDLTVQEQEVLEQTLRKRQATVKVLNGKQQLERGDFKKAVESFAAANKFSWSLKVSIVLLCLRIAPRLLLQAYKLRSH